MPNLGAHVSTAGGVSKAFPRGAEIGCDALQIFVKNANAWKAKALDPAEIAAFSAARAATPGANGVLPMPVVAHAGYLINLCSSKPDVHEKSFEALIDELQRCEALGVTGLVMHPGAHLGAGVEAGVDAVAAALDRVHAVLPGIGARVLLENTAGQGTVLGGGLSELAAIISRVDDPARVGVCIDTAHAFAAGYPIATADGYAAFIDELEGPVGMAQVAALHLNDSKFGCGMHKDRHANIGEGEIGAAAFARLVQDPRWGATPMLLETPLGDDEQGHARDLIRLRDLLSS
jgi:deoxyribonuclease-4